jgi:hypothetical protein
VTDALKEARLEAIREIQAGLFVAAGEAMTRHGNDPQGEVILAAAVAMFVGKVDKNICPGFRRHLSALLELP